MLRIAARVEASSRTAGTPADAWHDGVIKPLRALQDRATAMTKFLESLGRESGHEVESAAARLRGGILEMAKDVSRTQSRVADLVSRQASDGPSPEADGPGHECETCGAPIEEDAPYTDPAMCRKCQAEFGAE